MDMAQIMMIQIKASIGDYIVSSVELRIVRPMKNNLHFNKEILLPVRLAAFLRNVWTNIHTEKDFGGHLYRKGKRTSRCDHVTDNDIFFKCGSSFKFFTSRLLCTFAITGKNMEINIKVLRIVSNIFFCPRRQRKLSPPSNSIC